LGRYRESYEKLLVTKVPYEEKKDGAVLQKERITGKYEKTTKVESDTVHRDGRAINGMEGLKKLILEDKDKIAQNLLTKLSQYAMGRKMNYADSEMIHRLLEASKKNDYKLRDLMVSIIADESFTKR
jgi:nucleosome binding factor SPN SPT16 subunit